MIIHLHRGKPIVARLCAVAASVAALLAISFSASAAETAPATKNFLATGSVVIDIGSLYGYQQGYGSAYEDLQVHSVNPSLGLGAACMVNKGLALGASFHYLNAKGSTTVNFPVTIVSPITMNIPIDVSGRVISWSVSPGLVYYYDVFSRLVLFAGVFASYENLRFRNSFSGALNQEEIIISGGVRAGVMYMITGGLGVFASCAYRYSLFDNADSKGSLLDAGLGFKVFL